MRLSLVLFLTFFSSQFVFANGLSCEKVLASHQLRSEALELVEIVNELEAKLEKLRKSNGLFERKSKIERDRSLKLLKTSIDAGEIAKAEALYRQAFRKVEVAYYIILHHREFLLNKENFPEQASQEWQQQITAMNKELQDAYKDLGEFYVDYLMGRSSLEKYINSGTDTEKQRAERVLEKMGYEAVAKTLPDLNIDFENRPEIDEIKAVFWSQAEPLIALLKKDLAEEKKLWFFKYGLWMLAGLEKATMSFDEIKIGKFKIGGPKFQNVLGALFLISRDQYLKTHYLHIIEDLALETRTIEAREELLMELCNANCDELLETYARLGMYTEDWVELREHMKIKAGEESHQYKRIYQEILAAEKKAATLKGLSANYGNVADNRGRQLLISSAATSFWTLLFTTSSEDWAQLFNYLRSFFG